jgi:hypothetical protein
MNVNKKLPLKFLIVITCICVLVPLFIFVMISQLAKGPYVVGETNIAFSLGSMGVA